MGWSPRTGSGWPSGATRRSGWPSGSEPVKEEHVRRLSPDGGRNFAFTPDSSAVIYAAGNRVWRHPLAGSERAEIPLRLDLRRPRPPPLLLRRVRVLDFATGGFGPETSLLIEEGRIRWIGPESGRAIPPSAVVIDAAGRYAIPGLFDLHVHAAWANHEANPDAFIAYGITSVRDTGGRLDLLNTLSDRGDLTADPLPRYFFSGEIFEGSPAELGRRLPPDRPRAGRPGPRPTLEGARARISSRCIRPCRGRSSASSPRRPAGWACRWSGTGSAPRRSSRA